MATKKSQPRLWRNTNSKELLPHEIRFINYYIQSGDAIWALKQTGLRYKDASTYRARAKAILELPRVQQELTKIMEEARKNAVMSGQEVMEYFSAVTRGEIKDQFGLDAPLTERTRAAIELAKRTIDLENKQKEFEQGIPSISIKLIRE